MAFKANKEFFDKYCRKVNNRLLLKSLVIELGADVDEAQRPKAQALLETSEAAPGGRSTVRDPTKLCENRSSAFHRAHRHRPVPANWMWFAWPPR